MRLVEKLEIMNQENESIIPDETIINKIYLVRGQKVMLDADLAELYDVDTKQLKRAVKRNLERFPGDFMFELTAEEFQNLRCQFGTSSWGGARYFPMAFTDLGVSQLSTVLKSKKAIMVNLQIMRVFNRMQKMLLNYKEVLLKIEKIEQQLLKQSARTDKHEEEIQLIFKALKQLLALPEKQRKRIGYKISGSPDELAEPASRKYKRIRKK